MGLVSLISKYVTILFIMLAILGVIIGALAYYLLKIKKVASKEEQFDYSRFERKDSLDYVRFQQIINSVENNVQTHNGLIITDNGFRYIAGIKVSGYNFFSASAQEQRQSMVGMLSFLNTIEGDIQYRQSTKAIDLSENIDAHKKRLKEVAFEIEGLKLDHQELVTQSENYLDNPEVYANYDQKITEIERTIKCKQHTENELDIVIQYMEALSGTNIEAEKVQCWLYEWSYNSNDYTDDLTDEERYEVAAEALTTKTNSYISALSRTGCTCDRMSGEELLELFRYHYSPITSDAYTVTDLYNSSVNALYVSSDSLETLEKEAQDEKEYYRIINQEREEAYAQETLEQLEESMDLFTDEHSLVVSDESLEVEEEPQAVTDDTQNTEGSLHETDFDALEIGSNYDESDDLVIDTDDNEAPMEYYDAPPLDVNMPTAGDTAEKSSLFNFSFASEQDEEQDEIAGAEDTPQVIVDGEDVAITEAPTAADIEKNTEKTDEPPKKRRFHRERKSKKNKDDSKPSEDQMSIFDSVPFGNI